MRKISIKTTHLSLLSLFSMFFLIFTLTIFQREFLKPPEKVEAVVGDLKIGVDASGVGCADGEIVVGGGANMKAKCESVANVLHGATSENVTFGSVQATTFTGALSGNATTATTATDSTKVAKTGDTMTGQLWINNASPTMYFRDTDHRGAMIHINSNRFYILRGCEATNSSTWCTYNGVWPFYINMENNVSNFGGSITATSDLRLKTNIRDLPENTLDKVKQLRGVYFNWKTEADMGNNTQIGVIAQEVEGIFPELVLEGADGYKSVAYDRLGPILIEAVKEQQTEIDSLKSDLTDLQKELTELKQSLRNLK